MYSSDVTAGTDASSTQYNNLRKDLVLGMIQAGVDADAATITITATDTTKGKVRVITLGGNRTIAFSGFQANQSITLVLKQDGTGSRTVTWPTMKWENVTAPTLTTTANRTDIITIYYDGTDYYGMVVGQNFG